MKRFVLTLTAAAVLYVSFNINKAEAQSHGAKAKTPCPNTKQPSHTHKPTKSYGGHTGYVPPVKVTPPVRYNPPVVRVNPPVVRVNPPVSVGGISGGGQLTRSAWIGRNMQTGVYSIAFDTPGDSGPAILARAGYWQIIGGPTDWISARNYLRSIGAPGW